MRTELQQVLHGQSWARDPSALLAAGGLGGRRSRKLFVSIRVHSRLTLLRVRAGDILIVIH
jgi:hypothetical protein